MKTFLLSGLLTLTTLLPGWAQPGYQVTYRLGGVLTGQGTLSGTKAYTVYTEKSLSDIRTSAKPNANEIIARAMERVDQDRVVARNSQSAYCRNLTNNTLVYAESETPYRYTVQDDVLPEWTLLNESRIIGTYSCQKARTLFRGREYMVWFTRQIPVSGGPWKLAGLPGMILEAVSTDRNYQFLFGSCSAISQPKSITFHAPALPFPRYVQKVNQYYQHRANTIYAEVSTGFLHRFGLAKTSPVSMTVDMMEKDLARQYVSNTKN